MNSQPSLPDYSNNPSSLQKRSSPGPLAHPTPGSAVRGGAIPATGGGITPAFLWRVYCQWWKWIVPLGLVLATVAGCAVWFLYVPKFEATALVKIESETPFIAFDQGAVSRNGDPYVQTQIESLRGPIVLAPVLGRPEIASMGEIKRNVDPLKYLQKQLTVRQVGESELYRVSYVSRSAKDAATVANVIVAEYLLLQNNADKQRSEIVIEVLEKERLDRGTKVEQLRKRVVELAKALTGKDPFGQGVVTDASAFSPAAALYQSLTEADVSLEVLKAELQSLQNAPIIAADKSAAAGLLDLEISNRPDVRQLEEQVDEITESALALQRKRRWKIGDTYEKDPEYQRLREQANAAKSELNKLKEAARKEVAILHQSQGKAEQEELIASKMQELTALNTKREMLARKFNEHLQELKSGGAQSAELEFAKAELEREQKVFELIAARKLALQTELRAPARVSLMQSAIVPAIAMEPIPYKLLFLACTVALLAPFGAAVGHELIARRIATPEQLRTESLLPVLGEVARFPRGTMNGQAETGSSASKQRELHVYAESIDSLRTNLRLTENLGVPGSNKVVAVCSAASGEGKTSVATALAMSIAAAAGQPTLILDADLRDPDVGDFFNVPRQPGVAEVLSGKASLDEAIHRVGDSQTYVMPAGICRVNPHHLLHGPAIDNLLEGLREKFATIVIDTPPVLSASESLVYAKSADLVVFCSLADVSRVKQMQAAVERLQATGANLAGAVLNGVSVSRYVYHYGSYNRNG